MHRWVWDLRYPSPASPRHEYPISAVPHDTPRSPLGPLAVPGEYTARLTVNGHTSTAPLTIKIDPRVHATLSDLEQQFNLETRLASELTASTEALAQAHSLLDQLRKLGSQANGKLAESVKALDQKVGAILRGRAPAGSSPKPTLAAVNSTIDALYGSVGQADAAPTAAQISAVTEAEHDLSAVMKRWKEVKKSDLPALNRELKSANLSEINLQPNVPGDETENDLE
jgi:hypothetical protein